MRQSILCMSVSAVILGSGLSGCASLQTKWFGVKSSGVTLPSDMSKAAYLPIEETDYAFSLIICPGLMAKALRVLRTKLIAIHGSSSKAQLYRHCSLSGRNLRAMMLTA